MSQTVYRITAVPFEFSYEQLGWVPGNERRTVRRSQKGDYAYYESEKHARNGLKGIKSNSKMWGDPRIEVLDGDWTPVEESPRLDSNQ